jgi:hypothetical protein
MKAAYDEFLDSDSAMMGRSRTKTHVPFPRYTIVTATLGRYMYQGPGLLCRLGTAEHLQGRAGARLERSHLSPETQG